MMLGEIFRQAGLPVAANSGKNATMADPGGPHHERWLVGRNPPPGGDRKALRPGDRSAAALLAAHRGRCSQAAATAGPDRGATCRPARSLPRADQGPVGQVSRPVGGTHPRGDRSGRLHRQRLGRAPLSAQDSAGTRPRLPGGALRTGPGDAGRLGRMRPRPGRFDHAQGLGVRGRALL